MKLIMILTIGILLLAYSIFTGQDSSVFSLLFRVKRYKKYANNYKYVASSSFSKIRLPLTTLLQQSPKNNNRRYYNNNNSNNMLLWRRSRFFQSAFLSTIGIITVATTNEMTIEQSSGATELNFIPKQQQLQDNPRYIESEVKMQYGYDSDDNPRTRGVFVRRYTGDSTPYQFPVRPIQLIKEWPKQPPFRDSDFSREDPVNDGIFYSFPKLVYHIDEPAVSSLTQYYRNNIKPQSTILDICSSWVSHYPIEFPKTMKKIHGTGMNPFELQLNDQLTGGYIARDLNENPTVPYHDNQFDVVTCVVSIDYLIHPIEVLKEVNRILKPGGKIIISQSNRCFPSKAIKMWLMMNDRQHLELINGFLFYAGGYEIPAKAYDITATLPDSSYRDPMFIVEAIKK